MSPEKIFKIEDVYENLCAEEHNVIYFQTYNVVKSRLAASYYPNIRDVQPYMTDHSINHVERVLEKLSRLMQPILPIQGNPKERIIDMENLNLLMHSVLWHDVGNIYGRTDHAKNIVKVFDNAKTFLYDPMHQEWIVKIGQAHSGEKSIEQQMEHASFTIHDFVLYPRFLSALLRIADEMDEDERRIESRTLASVPKQNEAYWTFCSFNQSILPVYRQDTLGKLTLEIQVESKIRSEELLKKLGKNGDTVIALEEYVDRLDKMNSARKYCNGFLSRESAFYFHAIDKISVNISICDEHNVVLDRILFIFDDSTTSKTFFNDHKVKEVLNRHGGAK